MVSILLSAARGKDSSWQETKGCDFKKHHSHSFWQLSTPTSWVEDEKFDWDSGSLPQLMSYGSLGRVTFCSPCPRPQSGEQAAQDRLQQHTRTARAPAAPLPQPRAAVQQDLSTPAEQSTIAHPKQHRPGSCTEKTPFL